MYGHVICKGDMSIDKHLLFECKEIQNKKEKNICKTKYDEFQSEHYSK